MPTVPQRRLAVLVTACGLVLSGCASDSQGPGEAPATRVGIAVPTRDPLWLSEAENMTRQLSFLGYQVDVRYAEGDASLQASQVTQLVELGDKVLVVGAVNDTALSAPLADAAKANVKIVAFDRLIRETAHVDYYATFDNYRVGVLQAQAIVDGLSHSRQSGPYNVELFAGAPDDSNSRVFFTGAMSVLHPLIRSGKLVVRSHETSFEKVLTLGWDPKQAAARMQRLLRDQYRGHHLDAVLSPYDGLSRAIIDVLRRRGYGRAGVPLPVVTGQDAEIESVKSIIDGMQTQTIYKDSRELAKVAVAMVDRLMQGQSPLVNDSKQYDNGVKKVPSFLLQPISVSRNNYNSVLVDGGFYSAAQLH